MTLPSMVRRSFQGVLLVFVLTLALMAAGCAGSQGPSQPATGGGGDGGGQPKVKRLVFAKGPPAYESNRPAVATTFQYWPMSPMYEFLMGVAAEGKEPTTQLATEWSLDPDGKSYRFKLQKGIQFHYGMGELTAKDVRYTWQAMRNDDPLRAAQAIKVANQIQDVEVINDYELIIRLPKPDAGFLTAIGQTENVLWIVSKADGEARPQFPTPQERALAGTGPYRFVERQQGQYVRYERAFDQHWRQTPDFQEFEWRYFKEASTMLAALLAKEVQIAGLTPEMVPQAETAGYKTITGKAPGLHLFMLYTGVHMNVRTTPEEVLNPDASAPFVYMNTPLLDVRVRKALNKAIDRDALNKAFLQGKGDLIYNEYFHPTRPGWNPAWQSNFKDAYGYDPEAAKKLLAEAGYGPNKQLSTTVRLQPASIGFPGILDMDEAIANQWRAVGVKVNLLQEDSAVVTLRGKRLEYDNHSYVNITSIRQFLGVGIYNSKSELARGGVQLPELEAVYDEIRAALDPQKAEPLWRKWGDMAYERYVNVPLFWMPAEASVDPNIVRDYVYPGSISGTFTHMEYIKAAR